MNIEKIIKEMGVDLKPEQILQETGRMDEEIEIENEEKIEKEEDSEDGEDEEEEESKEEVPE